MTVNLTRSRQPQELKPRIIVFGVGGAGCNAVNNMLRSEIEGVECVVANTDAQALAHCLAERKIQLGGGITQGLGAGARPEIGRAAAEEALDEILEQIQGGHMVFITAGMGGGTGTGAAPVIARAARDQGLLTVGVVTKPFHFEGAHRMRIAEAGLEELQDAVDTLIIIPNQNLFRVANEKTTFADAFHMADQVLHSGVRGITDLMVMPGLINLDFADVRTVMGEMGKAMMGAGEADGENRAIAAAERAISNPLLDDVSMQGAKGLLINIAGGPDLTLFEVDEATNRVRDEVDPDCNIIFGSVYDESLKGRIRVSVFATGIDRRADARPKSADVKASLLRPQPVRMPLVETPAPQPAAPPRPAAARAARPAERAAERPTATAAAAAERPTARPAMAAGPSPSQASARARAGETLIVAPSPIAEAAAEAAMETVPASVVDEQPDMFARPSRVAHEQADEMPPAEPARPVARPAARAAVPMPAVDDTAPPPALAPRPVAIRAAEPERASKPSIFNLWRGRRSGEPVTKSEPHAGDADPPARLVSTREEAQTLRAGAAPQRDGERVARLPQTGGEPKAASARPGADDLLEIPAFLRRQAN